jgi:hypothetical protein
MILDHAAHLSLFLSLGFEFYSEAFIRVDVCGGAAYGVGYRIRRKSSLDEEVRRLPLSARRPAGWGMAVRVLFCMAVASLVHSPEISLPLR